MKKPEKKLSKQNTKTLKGILMFIGIVILISLIFFFVIKPQTSVSYKGSKFDVITQGALTFYQTSFNVVHKGEPTIYNIYLRNNPKKLQRNIPFEGELSLRNLLVLQTKTENLFCEGDWTIAIANLQEIGIFNIEIMSDKNATCSENGQYTLVQIEEGEESRIEQFGPSCYKLIVSDCEILPVTERYMIETFAKVNEELKKNE